MASMRKAKLDKNKLIALKNKNADLTKEDLIEIGDEIVSSTIEGFTDELRKDTKLEKLAEKNFEVIKEFFIGYKEGVEGAIKEYIAELNAPLDKLVKNETQKTTPLGIAAPTTNKTEDIRKIVGEVLQRQKTDFIKPKESFGGAASFGLDVLGGVFGIEKFTDKIKEERQRKESFIQTESKLRPDATREQLSRDYKTIKTSEKELRELQTSSNVLREQGYSESQIERILELTTKQTQIVEKLAVADPSRVGMTAAGEEQQLEQQRYNEKLLDEQEQQSELLQEIRDILKTPEKKTDKKPDEGQTNGGIVDLITKGLGAALGPLVTAVRALAPVAAVGAAAAGVVSTVTDIAEGKPVETLGDIVPEGLGVLNPFEWAARGGAYVGDKINKGYSVVSESLGGSGSLGGDIYGGVQAVKSALGVDNPMIEAGRGAFQKDLSEFKGSEQKQEVTTDPKIIERVKQITSNKEVGLQGDSFQPAIDSNDPTVIKKALDEQVKLRQQASDQVLAEYSPAREAQYVKEKTPPAQIARRQNEAWNRLSTSQAFVNRLTRQLEQATGEKQDSQSVTIKAPEPAKSEFADVKYDATTVGGMELPEPPPPAEKKEVNAIPASELSDPEAAAFESAMQEREPKIAPPVVPQPGMAADGNGALPDPDAEMGFEPVKPVNTSSLSPRRNNTEVKGEQLRAKAKELGITGPVQGRFEGGVLTGITDQNGKTHEIEVTNEKDKRNVEAARSMKAAMTGTTPEQTKTAYDSSEVNFEEDVTPITINGKQAGTIGPNGITAVPGQEANLAQAQQRTRDMVQSKPEQGTTSETPKFEQQGKQVVPAVKSETTYESKTLRRIAGEDVVPGKPLSDKQVAAIELSKASGNKYSPEIEAAYADKKNGGEGIVSQSTSTSDAPKFEQQGNQAVPVQQKTQKSTSQTISGFLPDKNEVERRVQEKLLQYPEGMRSDVSVINDVREEVLMEMKSDRGGIVGKTSVVDSAQPQRQTIIVTARRRPVKDVDMDEDDIPITINGKQAGTMGPGGINAATGQESTLSRLQSSTRTMLQGTTDNLKFTPQTKTLSPGIQTAPTDPGITDAAAAMAKNIVVNVPPANVVVPPQKQTVMPPPFSQGIRNTEPSVSDFIRRRYSF